jgi:hypothetical protein
MKLDSGVIVAAFLFLLSAIFVKYYWNLPSVNTGPAERFQGSIVLVSSIAVTITLGIAAWQLHKYRLEEKAHQRDLFVGITNKYFSDLEKVFLDKYPYLDKFYRELYASKVAPNLARIPPSNQIDPNKDATLTIHMCLIMLQDIENVIISIGPDADWNTDLNQEWLQTWRIWFGSPTLMQQYQLKKELYARSTQDFLNQHVFPYVTPLP